MPQEPNAHLGSVPDLHFAHVSSAGVNHNTFYSHNSAWLAWTLAPGGRSFACQFYFNLNPLTAQSIGHLSLWIVLSTVLYIKYLDQELL